MYYSTKEHIAAYYSIIPQKKSKSNIFIFRICIIKKKLQKGNKKEIQNAQKFRLTEKVIFVIMVARVFVIYNTEARRNRIFCG